MKVIFHENIPVASYWLAAISTGYSFPNDWKRWADSVIAQTDVPPTWIVDLSLANVTSDAVHALMQRKAHEDQFANQIILIGNAKLGFYWLRLERGDLSLSEFLAVVGDEADGGTADMDCESVFELVNCLESKNASPVEVRKSAAALFESYGRLAESQLAELQNIVES